MMTTFDAVVVATLEGLWKLAFTGVFLAPGRAISRAWGLHRNPRWCTFWAFYCALVFWIGSFALISLLA